MKSKIPKRFKGSIEEKQGENVIQNDNLSVAIFPRVSTEAQKEKGRSLVVQVEAMEKAVVEFGGKIVVNYGGQEHATPAYEHTKLEQLVRDSYLPFEERGWNAVMFYDNSRFSRDNNKASEYLGKLKRNKIRFFTVGREWDLYDPNDNLTMDVHTVTGQYQVMQGIKKSMESRIKGADDGYFTAGKPPFGRKKDKDTGKLVIVEKDKRLIETAARLYLEEGIGFIKIGKRLNKAPSVIQRALLYDAGDKYTQHFRCEELGIDESRTIDIPPTLDPNIWKLVKDEASIRRKYHPGVIKSERLLSSYLFCDDCGKRLSVQEQKTHKKNGKVYEYLYYRHPDGQCGRWRYVKGELVEELVMESIIGILSNSKKFKEALLKPHPSESQTKSLEQELLVLNDSIGKTEKRRINLINRMEEGISIDGLQERADKLGKDKKELSKRIEEIRFQLSNSPTEKEIKGYRKAMLKQIEKLDLDNLSFKEKRELIKMFCSGRDSLGRPNGIYIGESEDGLAFNLEGIIGGTLGYVSDNDPDLDVLVKEDKVKVEELRFNPLMDSFNKKMVSNG